MLDIAPVLEGWDFDPDNVSVRVVECGDKSRKIQMRLDLGLLQMEMTGRPDGKRPHGCESYFDYCNGRLNEHVRQFNTAEGFYLNARDCAELQREAEQYYYRYLSLFHLEEYEGVVRDTSRNLRVFDFLKEYAGEESDQYALEQYRPYVLMMNCRARSHLSLRQNNPAEAIETVEAAIRKIHVYFKEFGRPKFADRCNEIVFLKRFLNEIKREWITDPLEDLRKKMQSAVEREDYESAARYRDEINKLKEIASR